MSNYTKATNFASKDALPVGDAQKKVKGLELDNEFNAISNAVSTKADTNSPTFTGTPSVSGTIPASTTSTTQVATTAFVQAAVQTAIDNIELTGGEGITITEGAIAISADSNGFGTRTVSTSAPSGGSNGDIWYKV